MHEKLTKCAKMIKCLWFCYNQLFSDWRVDCNKITDKHSINLAHEEKRTVMLYKKQDTFSHLNIIPCIPPENSPSNLQLYYRSKDTRPHSAQTRWHTVLRHASSTCRFFTQLSKHNAKKLAPCETVADFSIVVLQHCVTSNLLSNMTQELDVISKIWPDPI